VEDASIIALFIERDEKAIAELDAKYGALCRGLIGRILNDRRDAEECLNDLYMRMWRSIPPAEPKNLEAFAAKAARNEALMIIRRDVSKRGAAGVPLSEIAESLPAPESVEDGVIAAALTEEIDRFLKKKGAEKRGIFLRRYWFFDTVKEIAERYRTNEDRVNSILFRLRKELKGHLEKEGFFYEK
jgi:RNA polymerase sigma-70 factor (ECF subfamily)